MPLKRTSEAGNDKTDQKKSKTDHLRKDITDSSRVLLRSFQRVFAELKSNELQNHDICLKNIYRAISSVDLKNMLKENKF